MTRIPFPSRYPQSPQPVVCALCGRLVEHHELYESDVEGLRGQEICIYHGELGTALSHNDLRGVDDTLQQAIVESTREEPFGDPPWWDAGGFGHLLQVDGQYIFLADGLSGIAKVSA